MSRNIRLTCKRQHRCNCSTPPRKRHNTCTRQKAQRLDREKEWSEQTEETDASVLIPDAGAMHCPQSCYLHQNRCKHWGLVARVDRTSTQQWAHRWPPQHPRSQKMTTMPVWPLALAPAAVSEVAIEGHIGGAHDIPSMPHTATIDRACHAAGTKLLQACRVTCGRNHMQATTCQKTKASWNALVTHLVVSFVRAVIDVS